MNAMSRAVENLKITPTFVQVDGNRLPRLKVLAEAVVKGDSLVPAISAASILAKTHRDALLLTLDAVFPQYGFAIHKGYPTPAHLAALKAHGPCVEHRRSFAPVRESLGA
jgi:ribonuclease HII